MTDIQQLDKAYHFIMESFVKRGQAPHFTELARDLSLSMENGKKVLHQLMDMGLPAWLYPDTSLITSFAPFNNLPTHYRITVDGQQKWFGQ